MNITGNIIAGQTTGETAEHLSRRFGKIKQEKESITYSSGETTISKSKQLDFAIPASTIGALSSGEFCGIVADNAIQKIKLKKFHGEILVKDPIDSAHLKKDTVKSNSMTISSTYFEIKTTVKKIVENEIQKMMNTPELKHLIIRKL
jgi:hypothetical protein